MRQHEKGIVHRDLKPGNVKIRPDGSVKVLDFGLAKTAAAESTVSHDSPTLMHSPTMVGVILGTAAYMAPEQARGKSVDRRADIWAFGVVLYEMLTGKRLFEGEDLTETLASVVKSEPNLTLLPEKVRPLLEKCLQKDPKKRLRDIADWTLLLVDVSAPGAPTARESRRGRLLWATVGGGVAAVLAAGLWLAMRPAAPHAARIQFNELPSANTMFARVPALSPDGRSLAAVVVNRELKSSIWIRDLDSPRGRTLAGTEGAQTVFWSPDSRSVAFAIDRQLRRTDVAGGNPQLLAELPGTADSPGAWSRRGVIVVPVESQGLFAVPASGGQPRRLTRVAASDTDHFSPVFLPRDERLLYCGFGEHHGVFSITVDATENTKPDLVKDGNCGGVAYTEPGYLVVLRDNALTAQAFDPARLQTSGDVFPAANRPFTAGWFWYTWFSASAGGLIVYDGNLFFQSLHWVDRNGKDMGGVTSGDEAAEHIDSMALSRDGNRLAVSREDPATRNIDIWVLDPARQTQTRVSFDAAVEHWPVWSPDGKRLVYESHRNSSLALYEKAVDEGGSERLLATINRAVGPCDWSPDGRDILYFVYGRTTLADLWIAPMDGAQKPYPLIQTEFGETCGQFSPDGRLLAYTSDESGKPQVYVRALARGNDGRLRLTGERRQISTGGGMQPRWGRDGHEMYYLGIDGQIMSVGVKEGAHDLESGAPVALFRTSIVASPEAMQYIPSVDGKRFLLAERSTASAPEPATVILNWTVGAKK